MPQSPPRAPAWLLLAVWLAASPAAIAALDVAVSIPPLHSLVAAVMHGVGAPHLLLRGDASPHTFSLRPSVARILHKADLVFWIGPALERPLARILPHLGDARAIAMLDTPGLTLLPIRLLEAFGDAGHGHPEHAHRGSAVGPPDPHIWLSPDNARVMADRIATVLGAADPAHAADYRRNAEALRTRLDALDRRLGQRLAGLNGGYLVFHDAYQYFERHYGLRAAGVVALHPDLAPGAAHLHDLQQMLRGARIRCLFSEPQFAPGLVATLTDGLAVRHAVLDPLGAGLTPGPGAYQEMMRAIGDTLAACLESGGEP